MTISTLRCRSLYEVGLFDRMSALLNLEVLNRVEVPSALGRKLHFPLTKT